MAETGNPQQWGTDYPPKEMLENDIAAGRLYVLETNGGIHGVFMFAIGEDPTYQIIENGRWLSDTEYGVIHRMVVSNDL